MSVESFVNNRISDFETTIKEKLETLTSENRTKLKEATGLGVEEIFYYQNLKSLAQVQQMISLEESQLIYNALNNWEKTPLHRRVTLLKLFQELKSKVE